MTETVESSRKMEITTRLAAGCSEMQELVLKNTLRKFKTSYLKIETRYCPWDLLRYLP
ncbi:MAG: hypothetical protein LV477_02570 [Candidatus Nitrosotalea sp.]|nr:hypothetical protein [Candidatus Nitrosotalea sp.]